MYWTVNLGCTCYFRYQCQNGLAFFNEEAKIEHLLWVSKEGSRSQEQMFWCFKPFKSILYAHKLDLSHHIYKSLKSFVFSVKICFVQL